MQSNPTSSAQLLRRALCALPLLIAAQRAHAQLSDPVIAALEQRFFASDGQQTDGLGSSVAISGDTLVAGAPTHDPSGVSNAGGAWVFVRSGSAWSQQAKLLASDGLSDDSFGNSVAIDGDTLVVGAYRDDHPANNNNAGSAYVFVRSGTVWTEQAKLVGSFVGAADGFGFSVAIEGDTIVVGAHLDEFIPSMSQLGLAYVFTRSGTNWSETAVLSASDSQSGDYFGESVAISGDTIAVGAFSSDDLGSSSGAVYVFVQNGATWSEQTKLLASDGAVLDSLGKSVAVRGDVLVAGAPLHDGLAADTGAVYAFGRTGTTWSEQGKLEPVGSLNAEAGTSVSLDGDFALIGAVNDPVPGSTGGGSAFLYRRSGSSWSLETKVTHVESVPSGHFGTSVSLSGDSLAIGAPDDSHGLLSGQGSGYAFRLTNIPQTYCTAKVNSLGCSPAIGFNGVPSATSASPFLVTAASVINNKNGLLFYGYGLDNNTFQGGYLCMTTPTKRTSVQNSGGTPPASCTGSYSYDFNARIQSGTDPLLVLGKDVYCQYWSRDPALGGGFPISLSNALQFAIQP